MLNLESQGGKGDQIFVKLALNNKFISLKQQKKMNKIK